MEQSNLQTTTLDNFQLKWRWTDQKYNLLSSEELSLITPLDNESAKAVDEKSLSFRSKVDNYSPCSEKFEKIESIECIDNEKVKVWLNDRMLNTNVIISWTPNTAVITTSELFIKYWDDFCYPSSDDVSIWPENEEWIIHYAHYEQFYYGKSKRV